MNTHLIALQLMAAQGILGALDTILHHEITEALPRRLTAGKELTIHAIRAMLYSVLFVGLSFWTWQGIWSVVLIGIFGIEIVLTLWDFVIEDKTRLLPATERVMHTVLAINGGAFIALLLINFPTWYANATAMTFNNNGWLSCFLALCGVGVGLSGIRDALAAKAIFARQNMTTLSIDFGKNIQTILVTGATGFVGQEVVAALLKNNKKVIVLTRNPKQAAWLFNGQVRCVANMQALAKNEVIDTIINLAGARILGWRWSPQRQTVLKQSRIGTTQALINWIAQADSKPRLLLSTSAIGYYGIQSKDDASELTENSPPQTIFMSTLCQEWEKTAQQAQLYGVNVDIMRFGFVMGQQGALPMMLLPIKLGMGGALGNGRQVLSWIHVHDIVRGMAHLCQLNQQRQNANSSDSGAQINTYNFTSPKAVTQHEFSRIAAKILNRPCFMPTPAWPMQWGLGEQAQLLLEGQRVAPQALLQSGFTFEFDNVDAALKDIV